MKKLFTHVFAIAALAMGLVGSSHAAFMTIDRTITDFIAQKGSPLPAATLYNSATIDLTTGALVAFSVTPVLNTYSAANVISWPFFDPGTGITTVVYGGALNGLTSPIPGTDDFLAFIDASTLNMSWMAYTIAGIDDAFVSTTSTFTVSIADDFGVPEPGTLALGVIATLAGLMIRRKATR